MVALARTGTVQLGRLGGMGDERAQRLVAPERAAVQVVGLALVPSRRGNEVDDRVGSSPRVGGESRTRVSRRTARASVHATVCADPVRAAKAP